MENTPLIYQALNDVMGEVQSVSKSQRVETGPARFNFRGVDAVVNAVGPALRKHGVVVVPVAVGYDQERFDSSGGKPMRGITIRIQWRFYAKDGSFIEAESLGESSDTGDKAVPKAHSVAYRTVLLQTLCIPTDEADPDEHIVERADPMTAARKVLEDALPKDVTLAQAAQQFAKEKGKDIREATPDEVVAYALEVKTRVAAKAKAAKAEAKSAQIAASLQHPKDHNDVQGAVEAAVMLIETLGAEEIPAEAAAQ